MKSPVALLVLLAALVPPALALPADGAPGSTEARTAFHVNSDGFAAHGYDPVSFFSPGGARRGDAAISLQWAGASWAFASAANRDAFAAAPKRYAPQYGGWCAWAVSRGYLQPSAPNAHAIVRGKLYLNWSAGVRARWSVGRATNIASGDNRWPALARDLLAGG